VVLNYIKEEIQSIINQQKGEIMSKTVSRNYSGSKGDVFDSALNAIKNLGYKIDNIDKSNGLLAFKTGISWRSYAGQEMSILITSNKKKVTVDISGRMNQSGVQIQLYDWNEAESIANKIFKEMDKVVKK